MISKVTRIFAAASCALAVLMLPLAGTGRAHMCTPDSVVPVPGALVVPRASGLARFSLSDRDVESLPVVPSIGSVSHVARSPDGTRLAVLGSRDEGTVAQDTVVFVFNFFDYLRKLAPGTN